MKILLNNITLGRFFPGNSFIHKLDPRVKILLMIVLLFTVFLSANYLSLFVNFFAIMLFVSLTKINLKTYLKSMKFILFIVLFTGMLNIFYAKGTAIFKLGVFVITDEGFNNSIFVSMRLIMLILVSSLLTFTTSPTSLTYAIERLIRPLAKFKIKTHELAMMMTIALRFIPTLLEETDKIIDAQKSRGANLETGNILNRIKSFVPVLVPLFVSSFRRAYDLALAMECRCYKGGEGRTCMKILRIGSNDIWAILIVFGLLVFVLIINSLFPAVRL